MPLDHVNRPPDHINRLVIVGGGTAGWMAAAFFSHMLPVDAARRPTITLIESDDIGTIGVGEATIPAIKRFNEFLGIDEVEFMKATQATFKLGIEFRNWKTLDSSYIHGFGKIGQDLGWLRAHQYWLKMRETGQVSPRFDDYSINTSAAYADRFLKADPAMPKSPFSDIGYAYHFDAGLFAQFLRRFAEARQVVRIEGKIVGTELHAENGFLDSVRLESGETIAGDLFIDCSGFRGLLIEGAMQSGYEEWGHLLPCDRAVAVPCASAGVMHPYTRSIASKAGWQWRIPLQHRTGNGHVFSSRFISDDEATSILMNSLGGEALAEPRVIRFATGKRKQIWKRNVVAMGLSAGFLEPLESTSIHLIQSAALRLLNLFPNGGFNPATIEEFNTYSDYEYERIRDFIIAHYKLTQRADSPMWQHCAAMEVPKTLQRKLDHFADMGRVFKEQDELFAEESWIQVLLGQGLMPASYDPFVDLQPEAKIAAYLNNITAVVRKCVAHMPDHAEFVTGYCPAGPIQT